ncbi:MAG TPA: hypothetical protein PLP71_08950 [Syntrophomonadaceae bacterium]|nr:hypothetical protein [Syntrophomonadaceae bacterium]HQD91135.1 hypothetical protein [Syntrophomonadaceae bacterium]
MWSFLVYLITAIFGITTVLIIDYATNLPFRTGSIITLLIGWFSGYLILTWSKKQKPGMAWAVFVFFFLFIPVVLFMLFMTLNKILHWQLPFGVLMLFYAAALVVTFLLIYRVLARQIDTPPPWYTPKPDERDINLVVQAGYLGFIFLTAATLLALLQPWLPYSDLLLWLGTLAVGELSWLGSYLFNSYTKRRSQLSNSFSLAVIVGFLMCTIVMLVNYSDTRSIDAGATLAVLVGFLLGYMLLRYLKSKTNFYWGTTIIMMLSSFILPAMVILTSILLKVDVPGWAVGLVWFLGLGIETISFNSVSTRLAGTDTPIENNIDERSQQHILLSGLFGFLALTIMLIFSLLQPWISPGDTGLWLGVLTVGMTVWLLTYSVLEISK